MADVKWVKITTDMFDNRKVKFLRKLPEGDSIVLIWVMLLTMAGRCNAGGMIFLTENIPYTPKMLADELGFEESTVTLALQALAQMDMVILDGDMLRIAGWEEYQNIEGMERAKELRAARNQRYYMKKKLEEGDKRLKTPCKTSYKTVDKTLSDALDIDIEEDIEIKESLSEIEIRKASEKASDSSKPKASKPLKHRYGRYSNVLLSDEELGKLQSEFPNDYQQRIERLSEYMESSGKSYKSHLATIRAWARKDEPKEVPSGRFAQYAK